MSETAKKNRWKAILLFPVLIAMILTSSLPMRSQAAYNREMKFQSDIVYLISLDQGTTIFSKNADKRTPMASLTKMTTAMVVLDNVKHLDKKVTVTQSELDELANTNSSTAGITAGEVLTVRQLLNLMLVHSANEAAVVLAHVVAGNTPAFVKKMNAFAKSLGCTNTHYMNPHGLDTSGHYTTARDLAKIAKYALKNSTFRKIVAQPEYKLATTNKRKATTYPNTNDLLRDGSAWYYKPCRGIKTGTTEGAGHALVSYATKNGYSYLCVIISGAKVYAKNSKKNVAFEETKKAYEWAFNNIKLKVVAQPSDIVTVAHVSLGKDTDHVRLVPEKEVTALIPTSVDASGISLKVIPGSVPKALPAPLKQGEVVGKAEVLYAGEKLTTVNLVAAESVHQSFFGSIGYYIKRFFSFTAVKIILVILLLGALFVWLVNYLYRKRNRQERVSTIRIKHDLEDGKPVRLVSSDYGRKTRQPKPKRRRPSEYREAPGQRRTRARSPYSSKRYNNAKKPGSRFFPRGK